jgi:hypothetical protein
MPVQPNDISPIVMAQLRRVDRPHFAVADGEHGQDGHVQRVADAPAGQPVGADRERHHDEHENQAAHEVAHRRGEGAAHRRQRNPAFRSLAHPA